MKFKRFTSFLGYDLKRGSQIIAIISAVISVIVASLLFFGSSAGYELMREGHPDISDYGGRSAFWFVTFHMGIQDIFHIVMCCLLYFAVNVDGPSFVRAFLRSSVIWLCVHGVLTTYTIVILFAADVTAAAVGAMFGLLILFPLKLYFTLVVNSYHSEIAPNHIWGASMRVADTYEGPRSCQIVPPVTTNYPATVLVTRS